VALVLLSLLVLGWVGVLLRNHERANEAALRGFFAPNLGQAERQRDLVRLADAQFLDPSSYWDLARANTLLVSGDRRAAVRSAEALVRAEPENYSAWGLLRTATEHSDPARSAQAAATMKRLNPLAFR
jgi:predicted Zn-dependent protease